MTDHLPESAPPDDIAEAFEALRGEVSLTRRAVEGLTAARERVPDYGPTLGQMAQALKQATEGIDRIERSPAARLSPAALADEIRKASVEARAEDRALLREARDGLTRSIGRIDGVIDRGQAADRQLRRLIWSGVGGALGGILLMMILPGAVARSLPASWHVPEWMAARTIGLDQRAAGERMIATSEKSDAEGN
ncbi:hypothetical protein FPZ54_12460 [Sphingomonas suaedae]|uniref:Uncharacterized protein n=1 Tax=Sphingomonas suaedae TaxID=2599297 RepID=A0A518RH31_9SPHN|nr:DUF6118 family protein [Sphingomonas suaedae]QDX26741.1 hypothetical protein FPZ54_12460 [Sphingomonas suaedae]